MNKVPCHVIEDLLPLYVDDVCSSDSKRLIEVHLTDCEHCAQLLSDLRIGSEIDVHERMDNQREKAEFGGIARAWKKSIIRSFIKGLLIAAFGFCAILATYYGLFEYHGSMVNPTLIKAQGYTLTPDQLTFRLQPIDGFCGGEIKTIVDEDENLYIAIYRSFVKEKLDSGEEEVMNYGFNQATKEYAAVYYGTPGNAILLWHQGETLPPADDHTFE